MRIWTLLIVVLALGTISCGATRPVPLGINAQFDGLAFWTKTSVRNEAPYTFHWYGNQLKVWTPVGSTSREQVLTVDACPGMKEDLDQLKNLLGPSASLLASDSPVTSSTSLYVGGPVYRLTYSPPSILGSVTFISYDPRGIRWVALANTVRQKAAQCLGS
jgi:hypothetical protein